MASKICPTDFDEYATVEQLTNTPDGAGGFSSVWSTRVNIWCQVTEKSGNETIDGNRLETVETVEFLAHYDSTIVTTDRISYDGSYYNIRRVDDLNRKRQYLKITAESGVAQ